MWHRKPRGPKARPKLWHRIIGVLLMVIGAPLMGLAPLLFLGMQIDGFGYLTGHGQPVTVTVVEGSHYSGSGPQEPGKGYYLRDGKRHVVTVQDVSEGQQLAARLAVTEDFEDAEVKAYAGSWAALGDVIWASILMFACVCLGWALFRTGRELNASTP